MDVYFLLGTVLDVGEQFKTRKDPVWGIEVWCEG